MVDKSLTFFIAVLFAVGGAVILAITWMSSMSLTEKIVPSVIGVAGIMIVFVRILLVYVRAVRVRITHSHDKNKIDNKESMTLITRGVDHVLETQAKHRE